MGDEAPWNRKMAKVAGAMDGPAGEWRRALVIARRLRIAPARVYPPLQALIRLGYAEGRPETDEEVRPGGLRGTVYRLTARGEWQRAGML